MAPTLEKYFLKRWAWPLLASLGFYGGLVLANETVSITKAIFTQGATLRWVLPFLATTLPETFGMVLPMAAVLGGLLGTQTLVEGSEWVASQGLGVGTRVLLRPWSLLAFLIILIGGLNAHFLVPMASRAQDSLKVGMAEEVRTRFIRPGAPPWIPPGSPNQAIWMASDGRIHRMEVDEKTVQHLVAQSMTWGREEQSGGDASILLRFEDIQGCRIEKDSGRIIQIQQKMQTVGFEIPSAAKLIPPTPLRYRPTRQVMAERRQEPDAWVELSRRISLPFSGAALLLLGIALGLGHPRFQKGGAILKSLGVIIAYYVAFRWVENQFLAGRFHNPWPLFLLPFLCFALALTSLRSKLKPHRSNRRLPRIPTRRLMALAHRYSGTALLGPLFAFLKKRREAMTAPKPVVDRKRILRNWTERLWLRNWSGALGSFLVLHLLIEFATRAGDMQQNHISVLRFLTYWVLNLPPFLAIVLPLAFLLAAVLTFSEATVSREWMAIRAGGVSLLQWVISGRRAWGGILAFTFLLQTFLAPRCIGPQDRIYREIVGRPPRSQQSKPWLFLGKAGLLWYLDGTQRWGFPLGAPKTAPVVLRWQMNSPDSQALAWGGLGFEAGPPRDKLFPSRSLQDYASAEEAPTLDLYEWERLAPDAERATLLWQRILSWLAGPCLVFGALSLAFPGPRSGRGQALGLALVIGLLYLGLEGFFGGAARAGEIPPLWGCIAPLLLFLGLGMSRLRLLRT